MKRLIVKERRLALCIIAQFSVIYCSYPRKKLKASESVLTVLMQFNYRHSSDCLTKQMHREKVHYHGEDDRFTGMYCMYRRMYDRRCSTYNQLNGWEGPHQCNIDSLSGG